MAFRLPMVDVHARWTGPLACLDDDAAERAGDGWGGVVSAYIESGEPSGLSDGGCMVTLRPLSAAEEDACEADAGPPVPYAGFIYRAMDARGVDLGDAEAVARATAALPQREQEALHAADLRLSRLRSARVKRALMAADFAPEGVTAADAVDRIAGPMRGHVLAELSAHLDRLTTLTDVGKAPAGEP